MKQIMACWIINSWANNEQDEWVIQDLLDKGYHFRLVIHLNDTVYDELLR